MTTNRRRALGVIAGLIVGCAVGDDPAVDLPPATPGLELAGIGYAAARSRFRTRLVRPGPASNNDRAEPTPGDAVVTNYRSGSLTLRAWASPVEPNGKRRPGVLFLHGGFALGVGHWAMTRPIRDSGWAVLVPSLRGEDGQPGACSLFFDEVDDVLTAADALASRPDVDPDRLYLAGHSVGGTLALLTSLASPRFRAAATFSAAPDIVEYVRGRPELVPFDPTDRLEFRMRSAVAFADRFRCPVRMYHGEDEIWLQPGTIRTALLAQRAGLDVAAVAVPGGHDSASPANLAAALAYFRRH